MTLTDLLLLAAINFALFTCPFTKVEESFNMQAIHDIMYLGRDFLEYDHLTFPGVVPRSFCGAIPLAFLSTPLSAMLRYIFGSSKMPVMILCRAVLGILTWSGILHFKEGVRISFDHRTADLMVLLLALQFHLPFYASRTLPNTFALVSSLHAYAFWLKGYPLLTVLILSSTVIIFRCDILVLLAPLGLQLLAFKEIRIWLTIITGLFVVFLSLILTVSVDSFLWQRGAWPEGSVFFFNTVENKSSEWGIQPWHWYFSHALLKALHVSLPFVVLGLIGIIRYPSSETTANIQDMSNYDATTKFIRLGLSFMQKPGRSKDSNKALYYCFPIISFVSLYSFLPHKELRFIFPAIPVLTMAAAVGMNGLLPPSPLPVSMEAASESKDASADIATKKTLGVSLITLFIRLIIALALLTSVALSSLFLIAAYKNYPGGAALERLLTHHIPYLHDDGFADVTCVSSTILSVQEDNSTKYAIRNDKELCQDTVVMKQKVHIDAAAAMTGITRFGQQDIVPSKVFRGYYNVSYSKDEHVRYFGTFDWLVTGDILCCQKTKQFLVVDEIMSFDHLEIRPPQALLSFLKMKSVAGLLRRFRIFTAEKQCETANTTAAVALSNLYSTPEQQSKITSTWIDFAAGIVRIHLKPEIYLLKRI